MICIHPQIWYIAFIGYFKLIVGHVNALHFSEHSLSLFESTLNSFCQSTLHRALMLLNDANFVLG